MGSINIMDVSAIVHTGSNSKTHKDAKSYGYPVGGIQYLMQHVARVIGDLDDVILCFDSRSFRKDLLDSYKAGRLKNGEVISQIETIYEELSSAGFYCHKVDTMEADDLINWAVIQHSAEGKYEYPKEIYVYGNDYDLTHNVQPYVTFQSISSNTNTIRLDNFSHGIDPNMTIKWNTISPKKVLLGDKSDGLPPMTLESGYSNLQLYYDYCNWLSEQLESGKLEVEWRILTDSNLFLKYMAMRQDVLTKDEILKDIRNRIKIVYPAPNTTGYVMHTNNRGNINELGLSKFCSRYGAYEAINCMKLRRYNMEDYDKEIVMGKARQLESGVFQVDRNIPVNAPKSVELSSIDMFDRRF